MDPSLYIDTIKYLLARGLKVIFVGNEKSSLVFESHGFINLSLVKRPGEVDIFLSAKAKFYFGNPCGPYHLASAFGTPCCLTHFIPYGGVRKNNFVKTLQFKYDLLKKIQKGIPEYFWEELESKEIEVQMWRDYAYKLKPREDKLREYIQYLSKINEELEEKLSKAPPS